MASRTAVEKGCLWRVGNRENIDIWTDCWVRSLPGFVVPLPEGEISQSLHVYAFMGDDGNRWDYVLVALFDDDIATIILQVPISRFCTMDKRIWEDSPTGYFLCKVCLCYNMFFALEGNHRKGFYEGYMENSGHLKLIFK